MMQTDYRDVVLKQRDGKQYVAWEGNTIDYLKMIKETPSISSFAPGRIFEMIMRYGVEDVDSVLKTRGYEDLVKYKFFNGKIFGTLEPIHDLMRFLKAAARRTETGKRILMMVGPVATGKSTIAHLIKRGLEKDPAPKYVIKDCPMHEEPLHLIPDADRSFWETELGVKIEGHVCPHCQHKLDTEYTENNVVRWDEIPIIQMKFSEQKRMGIGTFQPSDPKSQDVTELIGRVNMSKLARYGETDPRAYQFDGELHVANGGMVEYIEILKADIKFHYVLISVAQEQMIKSPGFPQTYVDTLIVSHTNQTEFDSFKSDHKNEALHDRMYSIKVPYNLRVDDEIKIYEKMINESDFRNIHIAPYTLKLAAQFAVLSRLKPSTKCSSLVSKMKLYNGEVTEEFKKTEIDIRALFEEGKRLGEGMDGISPRFIINALNVALGQKEEKKCINPIDVIRALRNNFEHSIGITEEDQKVYINALTGDKQSVASEFKEFAKKEVNMAFLYAYEDQAHELFARYMINCSAFVKKEKVLDSITGEYSDPDEILMRALEELIGVPENSKETFRNGIFVHKSSSLERGEKFEFDSYAPLRDAIEKKLMSDLKNVVSLSIATSTNVNPKTEARRDRAFQTLMKKGYCESCSNMLLSFVAEVLRKT